MNRGRFDLWSERWEFSVVSKREGQRAKRVVFAKLATAQRRVALLGPEPWLALKRQPDDEYDPDGTGETVREVMLRDRAHLPPLEYVRVEWRNVTEWRDATGWTAPAPRPSQDGNAP